MLIKNEYLTNKDIIKENTLNRNEIIEIYDSNDSYKNYRNYLASYRIIRNLYELKMPIIYNIELISEIIDEYFTDESNALYDEIEFSDEIKSLIPENASKYYFRHDASYEIIKNDELKKIEYDSYDEFSSESVYSLYDFLKLFNEIIDEYKVKYELYEYSENDEYFNNSKCYELIEYILSELNKFNFHFRHQDILEFKILLNISNEDITLNDMIYMNQYLLNDEIYDILIENDLKLSVLLDLYDSVYDSGILDIDYNDEISNIKFYDEIITEYYNYEYNTELELKYKEYPDNFYKNFYESLELTLNDLMILNRIISENDSYKMNFNIENISDLFESCNIISDENFFYSCYEMISESLYNEPYYNEYYYMLYSINSSNYKGLEISDIYSLIRIVLNELKHYNLNNSFKFSDELYRL